MLMRPTVAQVTADDPATAAITPQPTMFTCRSRPGSQLSQGARPLNMSSDKRDRNRISPIQMNRGNAVSAQFQLASQMVEAKSDPAGAGVKNSRATYPTARSEIATQMPLPRNRNMAATRTIEVKAVPTAISYDTLCSSGGGSSPRTASMFSS
jgi:hypothetical protein